MVNVIVIVGPTGGGKTKLAIKIANEINGEIINADAFQVYKEISIGTAKATKDETKLAKFYFNGEISIYDEWDIKIFQDKAKQTIEHIVKQNKVPIIVGGSNLYIDALIYNYDLSAPPRTDKFENYSCEQLLKFINERKPDVLKKIDHSNKRRLIRAAQLIDSGNKLHNKNEPLYNPIFIEIVIDRNLMNENINNNVNKMLKNGWKDEVVSLYQKDNDVGKLNAFKAIGYLDILQSLITKTDINVDLIKQKTRQYAKRQLTWIKHHYINTLKYDGNNYDSVIKQIKQKI